MTTTAFLLCPVCGEAFAPNAANQKYCGQDCYHAAKRDGDIVRAQEYRQRAKERRNTPGEYSAAGVDNLAKAIAALPAPRSVEKESTGYFPAIDPTISWCGRCGSQNLSQTRCKCGGWCA